MCAFTAHPSKPTPDALELDMRRRAAEIKRLLDKDSCDGGRDGFVTSVLYFWDDLPAGPPAWTAAGGTARRLRGLTRGGQEGGRRAPWRTLEAEQHSETVGPGVGAPGPPAAALSER